MSENISTRLVGKNLAEWHSGNPSPFLAAKSSTLEVLGWYAQIKSPHL